MTSPTTYFGFARVYTCTHAHTHTRYPLDRRLDGPGAGLDAVEKNLATTGIRTPAVQAAVRRYTDLAITFSWCTKKCMIRWSSHWLLSSTLSPLLVGSSSISKLYKLLKARFSDIKNSGSQPYTWGRVGLWGGREAKRTFNVKLSSNSF
jgi:hypothetical protein